MDSELDEVMEDFVDDVVGIYSCRRGVSLNVPKSIDWRTNILSSFDNRRFNQMLRVSRSQFVHLVNLIKGDEVFATASVHRQIAVDLQLAIVLFRLGSSGSSASVRKICTVFGVSDGGILANITERVFKAILRLMPRYIYWPDAAERQQIVERTFEELPHCVGYIDGSEIKLFEKPAKNHETYFSRQRIYSVKLQVICDHKLRIRDAVVGSPGSYHDSKVFKNCSIGKHTERYFSGEEWIAGDSAYPQSTYVVTPFRSNSRIMEVDRQLRFNKRHSQYRVRVENCFGVLKGKFCSLKEIRIRLKNKKSQYFLCNWILVCCILHNILLKDTDAENFDEETEENSAGLTEAETSGAHCVASESKRKFLYDLMFK